MQKKTNTNHWQAAESTGARSIFHRISYFCTRVSQKDSDAPFCWYSCFRHPTNENLMQSALPTRRGVCGGQKLLLSARYSTFNYWKHHTKCLRPPLEPSQSTFASSSTALANNKGANRIDHVYGWTLRSSIYESLSSTSKFVLAPILQPVPRGAMKCNNYH